ncbi:MAG: SPFH domain-containing protein [Actinomycetota bacterium]
MGILLVLGHKQQRTKRQIILEYKRGVRFKDGAFQEILLPGSYRYDSSKEQIAVVDLRPQPLLIERLEYADSAGQGAWISISASISVCDPRIVTLQTRDHVSEGAVAIRETAKRVVAAMPALSARMDRQNLARQLSEQCSAELQKIGLSLSSFDLTEVSAPAVEPKPSTLEVQ